MVSVKDALRAADPERREPEARAATLANIRARVLASPRTSGRVGAKPDGHEVGRRRLVLSMAAAAMLVVASGLVWQRGVTSVFAAVRFEVRLAEVAAAPGLREAPVGAEPRLVYLHDTVVVSNDYIIATRVLPGRDAEHFSVEVIFTTEGAQRMAQATMGHIGRPVALLVDGLVVMAPTVRSAIADRAVLTGDYTRADADRIASGMLAR